MAGVNKVIVIGNLLADPQLKHTANGNSIAKLTVATTEKWTDKEGKNRETVELHRIVAFGRLAENCAELLEKGQLLCIEGRLQTRRVDDDDGNKRWTTDIVAVNITLL